MMLALVLFKGITTEIIAGQLVQVYTEHVFIACMK